MIIVFKPTATEDNIEHLGVGGQPAVEEAPDQAKRKKKRSIHGDPPCWSTGLKARLTEAQATRQRQEREGADGSHRMCLVAGRAPATEKSVFASMHKTPYGTKSEEVASFTQR